MGATTIDGLDAATVQIIAVVSSECHPSCFQQEALMYVVEMTAGNGDVLREFLKTVVIPGVDSAVYPIVERALVYPDVGHPIM